MARAKPKTIDSFSGFAFGRSLTEREYLELLELGLPMKAVSEINDAFATFSGWYQLEKDAPSIGEVKEALRRGEVAAKNGDIKFQIWLDNCDARTREYLQQQSWNDKRSITAENFPALVQALSQKTLKTLSKINKNGRKQADARYELANNIRQCFLKHRLKITQYQPGKREYDENELSVREVGSANGSLFAETLRRLFRFVDYENCPKDIFSYL